MGSKRNHSKEIFTMTPIEKASKSYYLFFNLPLHLLLFVSLYFFTINFWLFLIFFVIVYWLGIQAGVHKLFSHKSWQPKTNFVKNLLAVISCFGLMGGPVTWAQMHRWHHKNSDTDLDPHSPKNGKLKSYAGWLMKPPEVPLFVIKDLIRDRQLIFIEKYCREIVLCTLLVLGIISVEAALSLLLAMIVTFHSEMMVNCFLHKYNGEKFAPINNFALSLISGGSTLHKNHHDNAGSANFSNKWFEVDLSYFFIKLLSKNENRN